MMRIILFFVIGVSIPWHNLAAAGYEWAQTQNIQLLPQYCKDRAKDGGKSAAWKRWRGTLGEAWTHMHHYCNGVYAEQKARSTINQEERKRWLRSVLGEMQYVGRHCQVRCVLYPELHTRWGWALGMNGQSSEAIKHFQLVMRAKPKYVPAYVNLSDLYVEINLPDDARRVLSEGLKAKPGSRSLQRRLEKLDAP